MISTPKETIVLIGHGMVGHRFCERLIQYDTAHKYQIVTFCEEPRAAYDRVGLTSFFTHRDAEKLMLARMEWYKENNIELHVGDRANTIDRDAKVITSEKGIEIKYDQIVLATGSTPFVPPIPGIKKKGVFVYRTIEDLEHIIAYAKHASSAAIIGGGLLGLEAAKACLDLGLKTHVVDNSSRLMARQLDDRGARYLSKSMHDLGVEIHLEKMTQEVLGDTSVEGLRFSEDETLPIDMVIVSAGIRPRDSLARDCGIDVGSRGGIRVNDALQTSDPQIFAIGEVACHREMVYGLVAPGYDMADIVADNLCGQTREFHGGDLSAKLKLMGMDVASFGEYELSEERALHMILEDPITRTYKKLLFDLSGTQLLGGILVGDAKDFSLLQALALSDEPLKIDPAALIGTSSGDNAISGIDAMPDSAQVCSCNAITKGALCSAITKQELRSIDDLKRATTAGTGCGGCMPLVTDLFNAEMKKAGITLKNDLCEHFAYSRQDLFQIIKIKEYKTFDQLIKAEGTGHGCETCKPTIASIIASLWNDHIAEHDTIQDTNDRFMANIQRQGLYSVVPRVPGGEITPEKLIAIGQVGKKYNLYTKITGGQRVDLFGAHVHQLPDIWEELINAGFESGHAYGKSLRTVKSCVGTTWCRFGVQDSVGFAIRVEDRYKGIRSPHKIKGAVSGCTRECAEAQSKDFGLIATEKGWNLYVAGNGGTKPRHGDLLASDLDEDTAVKYIDRFLMYYIHTADRLTRTSVWLDKLEGGIETLKDVVINDSLGLCQKLEEDINRLIQRYHCEWTEVIKDPAKRAKFKSFINSDDEDSTVTLVDQRGQIRPGDWNEHTQGDRPDLKTSQTTWVKVGKETGWPQDGGASIRYGKHQIAVYKFNSRNEWYACQNQCPHKRDMVLSRGIIGDTNGTPKVACPMHKKTFNLQTGQGMSDPNYSIQTFPVKIEDGAVYVQLPSEEELDKLDIANRAPSCAQSCSSCG